MGPRVATRRWELPLLSGLVVAAFAFRVALAIAIAPLQAPDEAAHVRYVKYISANARLPVQSDLEFSRIVERWNEYHQPPLAYLLFAPIDRLMRARSGAALPTLRALRVQNALYGAAVVAIGFFAAAGLTPPGDPRRWLVALALAFTPGIAVNSSVVNNDGLANLLCAALWLPLLRSPPRWQTAAAAGGLLGAACLAKPTAIVLAPLLWGVPVLHHRAGFSLALRHALISAGVAIAVLSPWMVRNVLVYGDPFGIGGGAMTFGQLARVQPEAAEHFFEPSRLVPNAFLQFWGVFGSTNGVRWQPVQVWFSALGVLAVVGWLVPRGGRGRDPLERGAACFLAAFALTAFALVYASIVFVGGAQGRYLYPATLPVMLLLASGWARLSNGHQSVYLVIGLGASFVALDVGLVAFLSRAFAAQS